MICDKNLIINMDKFIFIIIFHTVTVFAKFLGISGLICFIFAIFSTNICIGINDIKWLINGKFGIYIIKWYFLIKSFIFFLHLFAYY